MKLTGKLKTQVDNAPTKEEKRDAIKKAGMLLSDDELDQVAGGFTEIISDRCPYNPCCDSVFKNSPRCKRCVWWQG